MSLIPIRCFTCGKVIGDKWETYTNYLNTGKTAKDALDTLGLTRYCCRRMLLGHVNTFDDVIKYSDRIRELEKMTNKNLVEKS